ncbi:MAG: YggT family protein [Pseudomonadota bacterium]
MRALLDIVMILLNFAQLVIFVYIIFSWLISFRVLDTRNQFVSTVWRILYQMTEPVLRPIRNAMPKGWAIDLSPLIVILAIIFLQRVIIYYIYPNVI